jgi:type I restriction enzyme M protein
MTPSTIAAPSIFITVIESPPVRDRRQSYNSGAPIHRQRLAASLGSARIARSSDEPYAGVSTAIRVFTKGGKTDHVFFYDVGTDGFSLDDKRDAVKDNDLPDALERWRKRSAKKDTDRTAKHFMVPVKEIEAKGFDLSINRYKEAQHDEMVFEPPKVIIAKLRKLEAEIPKDLDELEAML